MTGSAFNRGADGPTGATGPAGAVGASGAGPIATAGENITSTTYAAYTTAGPAVTVTIGTSGKALVFITVLCNTAPASNALYAEFAVSGATTVAASDDYSAKTAASGQMSGCFYVSGLTPGSNTFTSQGRVTGGTGNTGRRYIAVLPL